MLPATQALEGIWVGYSANVHKRMDDSARVGVNRLLTTVAQVVSLFNAVYLVEAALKASNVVPLKGLNNCLSVANYAIILTPIVTNLLCSKLDLRKNPYLKRTLLVINNHIGSLCQIAVGVSAVALIVFGQPVMGSISLAFVILGFAQRRCWLPLKVSNSINFVGFVGINAARIVLGDPSNKFVALCEIGNFAYIHIARLLKSRARPKTVEETKISITDPLNIQSLVIDQRHLTVETPIPSPPEIDLKELNMLFEGFDWTKDPYKKELRELVSNDEHWIENYSDRQSDKQLLKYVQDGLKNFISDVSNCTIKTGELSNYSSLQARAKHVAHKLKSKSRQEQGTNLIRLALASYYCPAGYIQKVRDIYYTVCGAFEEDSLQSKVNQILGDARRYLFQTFLYKFTKGNPFELRKPLSDEEKQEIPKFLQKNVAGLFLDPEDNHIYNEFVNFLGEKFHLTDRADAEEDSLALIDIVSKKFIQLVYTPLVRPFLKECNEEFIFKNIYEAITNRQIAFVYLEKWFKDQYIAVLAKASPKDEAEDQKSYDERLRNEAQEWVHENVFDEDTGIVQKKYLAYFLIKMGVLKLA